MYVCKTDRCPSLSLLLLTQAAFPYQERILLPFFSYNLFSILKLKVEEINFIVLHQNPGVKKSYPELHPYLKSHLHLQASVYSEVLLPIYTNQ